MIVETRKYLAKDGIFYDSYDELRAANVRCNDEQLKALGLGNPSESIRRKTVARVAQKQHTPPDHTMVRRSSSRVRKEPESFQALDEDLAVHSRVEKKKRRMNNNNAVALSEEERQKLRLTVKWMDELEEYLNTEEHLSQQNLQSVMRQVEKLVSGEGITYSQWDDGVFFAKGSPIQLSDDFDDWYEQAVLFENEHGRDRGNGWLLRHPMKKIQNFQRYRLEKAERDQ